MTNVGFWFLLGAAFVSAAVISWVCFLELIYQRERRRSPKHASATSLSEFHGAGATRGPLLQLRKPAHGFRRQPPGVKIADVSAQVAYLRARRANEGEHARTPLQFCR